MYAYLYVVSEGRSLKRRTLQKEIVLPPEGQDEVLPFLGDGDRCSVSLGPTRRLDDTLDVNLGSVNSLERRSLRGGTNLNVTPAVALRGQVTDSTAAD